METIRQAEDEISHIIQLIKNGKKFPQLSLTVKDKMNSGIINDIFYPIHAKKFYAEDTCISCGMCATVCPLNNIRIANGKPE